MSQPQSEHSSFEVELDLDDIIRSASMESFNELVEDVAIRTNKINDGDVLEDISYEVVGRGATEDDVVIRVTAQVIQRTDWLDTQDDDHSTIEPAAPQLCSECGCLLGEEPHAADCVNADA
jgi:hypothetical protein